MSSQVSQLPTERTQTMTSQSSVASQISSAAARKPSPGDHQQSNGYPASSTNGYYPNQRQSSGLVQPQPQPQYLPQPLNPNQRPYPQPQRIDARQPAQSQYNRQPPSRGYPPGLVDSYKPIPNRGYPSNPALNADAYRTQSMATMRAPAAYNPPPSNYNQASANSFRQPSYQSQSSRTTAQGRIVPERHDERAMSMNSFSMERDHNQTMSGRVIPNRRRESGAELPADDESIRDTPSRTQTLTDPSTRDRTTSPDETPSRTMSMGSTNVKPSETNDSLHHRP